MSSSSQNENVVNIDNENISQGQEVVEQSESESNKKNSEKTVTKNKSLILYTYKSKGPFEVLVESKNNNIGNLHSLAIAKKIFDLKLEDVSKLNRRGRNRIGVSFKNYRAANDFAKRFEKGSDLCTFIPYNRVTCKGVVKLVDLEFSEEFIEQFCETNLEGCDIINVRRMNRRTVNEKKEVIYVPTGTICFTFTGTGIPREITICGLSFLVYPYILPVIQCYNCLLYGHTRKLCRGKQKCYKCGKPGHEEAERCSTKCYHCNSLEHLSTDRVCPENNRQKRIKDLMSLENKTYFEANEMVPMLQNKRKDQFRVEKEDFPLMKGREEEQEYIDTYQRRDRLRQGGYVRTYSEMAQTNKKKRTYQNSQGYDKEEYSKHLLSPNGRSTPLPRLPIMAKIQEKDSNREDTSAYIWQEEKIQEAREHKREDILSKTLEDIMKVARLLSLHEKMEVLNYMTQLESIKMDILSSDQDEPKED